MIELDCVYFFPLDAPLDCVEPRFRRGTAGADWIIDDDDDDDDDEEEEEEEEE